MRTASCVHLKNDLSFLWFQICKNFCSQQCCWSGSVIILYESGSFHHKSKKYKKHLDSYYFVTFRLFIYKKLIKCLLKSNKQNFFVKTLIFYWHFVRQYEKSRIRIWSQIRTVSHWYGSTIIRIRTKVSRFQNTDSQYVFCSVSYVIVRERTGNDWKSYWEIKEKYACYCFWNLGGRWADLHPREQNRSIRWLLQW